MQEARDRLLLVEPFGGGEDKRIDAAKLAVRRILHEPLEGIDNPRLHRLAEHFEESLSFTHADILYGKCRAVRRFDGMTGEARDLSASNNRARKIDGRQSFH
ncbi:hypothetical protein ABIA19_001498 [Sinorhizobium fredii]